MKDKRIMFYDIETLPLSAYIWGLGEQSVRHGQLHANNKLIEIICIQYCINNGPIKLITRDLSTPNNQFQMIAEFDGLVRSCDLVIGKNSDRFDNRHINTLRLIEDTAPMPHWIKYTDDLEKRIRKHFHLPSYSLDYISELLGFGGKQKMEFGDWVSIKQYFDLLRYEHALEDAPDLDGSEILHVLSYELFRKETREDVILDGVKALNKMYKYGKKDIKDTRDVWNYCSKHFETRVKLWAGTKLCQHCGSENIEVDKERANEIVTWWCNDHEGYAGRSRKLKRGGYGSML